MPVRARQHGWKTSVRRDLSALRSVLPRGTRLIYGFDGEALALDIFRVPRAVRGRGSEYLAHILAIADRHGLPTKLTADPTDDPRDPDTNTLVHWYRRFGFRVAGEDQDTGSPAMLRLAMPWRGGHEAVLDDYHRARAAAGGINAVLLPQDWREQDLRSGLSHIRPDGCLGGVVANGPPDQSQDRPGNGP